MFKIQTNEKISTRLVLTAKGTAASASVPRSDNPYLHLSRAVVKLSDAEQPIKLNATTRAYLRELSRLSEYAWLDPILRSRKLDDPATQQAAAAQIRAKDPDLDALLHTTVSVTTLNNGTEAQVDVRRTPSETREEILLRFKQIINDPAVEIAFAPGLQIPSTDASPRTTVLYKAMERAVDRM